MPETTLTCAVFTMMKKNYIAMYAHLFAVRLTLLKMIRTPPRSLFRGDGFLKSWAVRLF